MVSGKYAKSLFDANQEVVEAFRVARAYTPESAIIPPPWSNVQVRQTFADIARKRAVVGMPDGRYYLDEARLAACRRAAYRRILLYVVLGIGLMVAAMLAGR